MSQILVVVPRLLRLNSSAIANFASKQVRFPWVNCGLSAAAFKSRKFSSVEMSNKAAFLEEEKGRFVVKDAEIGEPGPGEILVKVRIFLLLEA